LAKKKPFYLKINGLYNIKHYRGITLSYTQSIASEISSLEKKIILSILVSTVSYSLVAITNAYFLVTA